MSIPSISIGLAFVGGLLTVLSPCILPILPIVVGRSLQSHRYGPVFMVLGLVSGFAAAGSLLGIAASWLTQLSVILRNIAIGVLLWMGILTIFPKLGYRFFSYFRIQPKDSQAKGLVGEFWLGTQLGLLWTPCAGPVLGSILILSAVQQQIVSSFALLVVYGFGAAVPLLTIAYGGRYLSSRLLSLRSHSETLQRIGGIMIVITSIAILLGWDIQVQLWLAPFFPAQSI
jgi:cytochrome c-type biogenesis protein